jgi:citrate synthase
MANDKLSPTTRIGTPTSDTERLRIRGRNVLEEIVGEMSFAEAYYFIVTGRMPTDAQRKIFDAALIILMDHGLTPTALVARLVGDSLPDNPQAGVAAGILMVGDKFVGSIAGAGAILEEGMAQDGDKRAWAAELVTRAKAEKRYLPGFGHPYYHPTDPRSNRLFQIAEKAGVEGHYIDLLKLLGEELDKLSGRHFTINATAALGALLCEIDFPVAAMRGVAVVGRAAGLVAHVMEEGKEPITPALMDFAGKIAYADPE